MADALNGQWIKVLEARHYGDDVELTPKDLDSIVRNYRSRKEDAPVGVGSNWRGAKSFGSIADLRRDGNFLLAKMERITPQLEASYRGMGSAPKIAVALAKTPNGPSLQRIGVVLQRENGAPLRESDVLDQSVGTDAFGNDEVIFSEERPMSQERDPASRMIGKLKRGGYWKPVFNDRGLDHIARALNGSDVTFGEGLPVLAVFGSFMRWISVEMDRVAGGRDADLHLRAQQISRERNLPYIDSLEMAEQEARSQGYGPPPIDDEATGVKGAAQEAKRQQDAERILRLRTGGGASDSFRAKVWNQAVQRVMQLRNLSYSDALSELEEELRPNASLLVKQGLSYDDALYLVLEDRTAKVGPGTES